jgi:hypothetical protein
MYVAYILSKSGCLKCYSSVPLADEYPLLFPIYKSTLKGFAFNYPMSSVEEQKNGAKNRIF